MSVHLVSFYPESYTTTSSGHRKPLTVGKVVNFFLNFFLLKAGGGGKGGRQRQPGVYTNHLQSSHVNPFVRDKAGQKHILTLFFFYIPVPALKIFSCKFVKRLTKENCLAAVTQDSGALHYVRPEICLAAHSKFVYATQIFFTHEMEQIYLNKD